MEQQSHNPETPKSAHRQTWIDKAKIRAQFDVIHGTLNDEEYTNILRGIDYAAEAFYATPLGNARKGMEEAYIKYNDLKGRLILLFNRSERTSSTPADLNQKRYAHLVYMIRSEFPDVVGEEKNIALKRKG